MPRAELKSGNSLGEELEHIARMAEARQLFTFLFGGKSSESLVKLSTAEQVSAHLSALLSHGLDVKRWSNRTYMEFPPNEEAFDKTLEVAKYLADHIEVFAEDLERISPSLAPDLCYQWLTTALIPGMLEIRQQYLSYKGVLAKIEEVPEDYYCRMGRIRSSSTNFMKLGSVGMKPRSITRSEKDDDLRPEEALTKVGYQNDTTREATVRAMARDVATTITDYIFGEPSFIESLLFTFGRYEHLSPTRVITRNEIASFIYELLRQIDADETYRSNIALEGITSTLRDAISVMNRSDEVITRMTESFLDMLKNAPTEGELNTDSQTSHDLGDGIEIE